MSVTTTTTVSVHDAHTINVSSRKKWGKSNDSKEEKKSTHLVLLQSRALVLCVLRLISSSVSHLALDMHERSHWESMSIWWCQKKVVWTESEKRKRQMYVRDRDETCAAGVMTLSHVFELDIFPLAHHRIVIKRGNHSRKSFFSLRLTLFFTRDDIVKIYKFYAILFSFLTHYVFFFILKLHFSYFL